jgi:DnaK suppressor protein
LSRERDRIQRELERLEPRADDADPGDGLFETELDASLARTLRERLAAIERAEQRLAEGSYGFSVRSGEPIPDARLEFDPAAELTVEEQRQAEGRG